jgi:hypothetical protein
MRRTLLPAMIGALLLLVTTSAHALVLVDNGQPKATIVVAATPSGTAMEAATDLQTYIQRISGAVLPIKNEKEAVSGTRILVGQSDAVKELGVKVPSGFTYQMNEEGFVIKTVGDNLVLAGNEDWNYRGTIFSVFDLLERLGCRWFFPGAYGEVIPRMDTISVGDMDILERPSFRIRNVWYSGWMPANEQDVAELAKWRDCNKLEGAGHIGGGVTSLVPPDKYFDSHPEVYALDKNGNRTTEMLCMTNPETVKIAVQTITDAFRNDPTAFIFGISPPDGWPMCYCPDCQKELTNFTGKGFGDPSISELWFNFVNKIATEVKKEFPDRWILTDGYNSRVRPPEGIGQLSDNITIWCAVISSCTFHPIGDPKCWQRQDYEKMLTRWTNMLHILFIYDYDPGKGLDNLPFPNLHNIKHDIPWFKERGVWGIQTEGNNNWMVTHLDYYVRAKLMWDVNQDVDALVRDYCEKFYGKAADPIEDYIGTEEKAVGDSTIHETWGREVPWKVIFTPEVVRRLDADVAKAEALADTPDHQLHVRILSLVTDHLKAFLEMERAADGGDFAEAVKWADEMQRIKDEMAKTDPALLPNTSERYRVAHPWTSLESFRSFWQNLADKAGGDKGQLVAMLPRQWEFKPDPGDDGVIYQWYLPGVGGRWNGIDTTLNWQAQGYQDARGVSYWGKAWYRASFNVSPEAEGKPLTLTFGAIYNSGIWIWLNGELIDYRASQQSKQPFDVDVTGHIKAGQVNTIAVLVNTGPPDREQRSGIYRRAFIWTPR